jgi:hypothetical protein
MAKIGAPGTKAPAGTSIVEDSSSVDDFRINIVGPPGVGKTFAAMTASKYWGKPGKLKDMLHIAFDTNPGAGFGELGYTVPTINVRKLLATGQCKTILDVLTLISTQARAHIAGCPEKVTIVCDTMSALDKMLASYWDKNCPITKSGNKDTMQMWVMLRNTHIRFYHDTNNMDANLIMIFHAKAVAEAEGKMGEEQQKKIKATGLSGITLDITGGSLNIYTGDSSAIFWMTAKKAGGKQFVRKLHPLGLGEALGKNRWQKSLEEEEDADLGKIIAKIKKNSGG